MDVSSFMGGNFLTHLDLPQPFQVWTINAVDQQLVGQGATAETKICVKFSDNPKSLALNKTNLKRLAGLYGTDANNWIGKQTLVFRSSTTFSSEVRLCVRLCGPQQAPPDPVCDPQGNAVQYMPLAPQPQAAPHQAAAPVQAPVAPQPVTAPAAAAPPQQMPWERDDNSPPSA